MEKLNSALSARVFTANDPGYEEARLAWNRRVQQRPTLIVEAKSASDVQTAVNYARKNNLGVAVQATGHGNLRLPRSTPATSFIRQRWLSRFFATTATGLKVHPTN